VLIGSVRVHDEDAVASHERELASVNCCVSLPSALMTKIPPLAAKAILRASGDQALGVIKPFWVGSVVSGRSLMPSARAT
jgi:hypothetical protein